MPTLDLLVAVGMLWATLGYVAWSRRAFGSEPLTTGPLTRPERIVGWTPVLLFGGAVLFYILPLPLMEVDDWLWAASARWLAERPGDAGTLLTEYANPREPYVRVLPMLWYGFDYAVFGPTVWVWRLGVIAMHGVNIALVYRLATRLRPPNADVSPRVALIAAAVFALHPAHAEVLSWLQTGREVTLMTALVLGTLLAHLADRRALTLVLVALAFIAREHAFSLLLLIPLVDWVAGRPKAWKTYASVAALMLLALVHRAWLADSATNAHGSFLADLFGAGFAAVSRLLVDVPAMFVLPVFGFQGPTQTGALVGAAALVAGLLVRAAQVRGSAEVLRWIGFALVWLTLAVGPAVGDLAWPEASSNVVRFPELNLRHTYLALVGPCVALGWLVTTAFGRSWAIRAGAIVSIACGVGLIITLAPYVSIGQRVAAAMKRAQQDVHAENVAIRFREPQDPAVAALLFAGQVHPEFRGLPVLVGEPRCGCVILPLVMPPAQQARLADLTNAITRPLDIEAVDPGEPCRCVPWSPPGGTEYLDGAQWIRAQRR